MAVIKELDLGFTLASPVQSPDGSCHVVVLLGGSDRSEQSGFCLVILVLEHTYEEFGAARSIGTVGECWRDFG